MDRYDRRAFRLAWTAYVVVTFVAGYVWHLVLFESIYADLAIFSRLDDPIIPLGIAAMVIQGAVLAFLYPRVAGRDRSPASGLRFGLLLGVLMASSAVIAEAAKQRVTSLPMWIGLESVYYLLQFGAAGLLIGWIYGRRGPAAG